MSPAGFDHGGISMNVAGPLHSYVRQNDLGVVVSAEAGFIVGRDPDTVRVPDVAFVRKDRIPKAGRPQKFWIGAPDLAVETMSPNDTVYEVDEKVEEWLTAGALLVWVLNPRQKTVTVHRAERTVQILRLGDVLDGENVVPGFRMPVSDVFA
jgi:Uma2 family endonuclease